MRAKSALLLMLFAPAGKIVPGAPSIVAVVNGRRITREDLERRVAQSRSMDPERFAAMTAAERQNAITRLLRARVAQELEYQEAVKRGIEVPDGQVELAVKRASHAYPSGEAFEKSLLAAGITLSEWRAEMKKALMIRRLEERIAARERPEWIKRLWEKSRIWIWQPSDGQ